MIKKGETYIIGEIGQNHNGSVDIAKLIVDLVCRPVKEEVFGLSLKPINAVKLTKRDLNEELSTSQMNRIYDTPNSFGRTYGEHRAVLELSDEDHLEVYKYAKAKGLDDVELDDDDFTDYKDSLKRMRDHDDALDDELIEEEYQSRRINAE